MYLNDAWKELENDNEKGVGRGETDRNPLRYSLQHILLTFLNKCINTKTHVCQPV